MGYLSIFLFPSEKTKITKHILLLFVIIVSSHSLIMELKPISIPYLSLRENITNSNLRHLSEQYVYGSAFKINYYYSNLYLGEKMEKQGYILDTGSSITTSTCSPICTKCGKHICPPYNVTSKDKILSCYDERCSWLTSRCSTHDRKCSFSISYSEGSSLDGVYINEIVRFGENYQEQKPIYVPIGCTKSENHLFYNQDANGIMGLANNDHNFIDILYKSGAINSKIFSLCLAQLGGVFNIGEINYKIHGENVTFVPMLLDRGKYFGLTVKSLAVNNRTINSFNPSKYNIFIDSGTTISYIDNTIFDEILNLMKDECKKFGKIKACGSYSYHSDYGHCFYFDSLEELDYAVYNYWPIIHFYLDGYDYKWKGKNYVFNISTPSKPGACMGINKYYGSKITLGSSWMIGHDIIFDRDKRIIGIAEAECYQNKILNMSSGLELNDETIKKIKNESMNAILNTTLNTILNTTLNTTLITTLNTTLNITLNTTLIQNSMNSTSKLNITKNTSYMRFKFDNTLDILLIFSIIVIMILLISIVILGIKLYFQKKILDSEIKNEINHNISPKSMKGFRYIEVNNNNLKESNILDII